MFKSISNSSFLLLFSIFFSAQQLKAQESDMRSGNLNYDELHFYQSAAGYYENVLKTHTTNVEAMVKLADCNYYLNNMQKAANFFQQALRLDASLDTKFYYHHARALLALGRYDDVAVVLAALIKNGDREARQIAAIAGFAKANKSSTGGYTVSIESGLNSSSYEIAPSFWKDKFYFVTGREKTTGGKNKLKTTNSIAEAVTGSKGELTAKTDEIGFLNKGPLAFSKNTLAYCENQLQQSIRPISGTGMQMTLYTTGFTNSPTFNGKAVPFNESGTLTGMPAFSPDGKKLYFVSDREGGFGGFDIYVSELTATGWSQPENLGSPINTAGDEITPFLDEQGNLYFSSDWHLGFGGMDIFKAAPTKKGFDAPKNLGSAVNSSYDDFYFALQGNEKGYFCSNRAGGKGMEDIYSASLPASASTTKPQLPDGFAIKGGEPLNVAPTKPTSVPTTTKPTETNKPLEHVKEYEVTIPKPTTETIKLPETLYTVQLGVFSKINQEHLNTASAYGNIIQTEKNGLKIYSLGYFKSSKQAESIIPNVVTNFPGVTVKSINTSDAKGAERIFIKEKMLPEPKEETTSDKVKSTTDKTKSTEITLPTTPPVKPKTEDKKNTPKAPTADKTEPTKDKAVVAEDKTTTEPAKEVKDKVQPAKDTKTLDFPVNTTEKPVEYEMTVKSEKPTFRVQLGVVKSSNASANDFGGLSDLGSLIKIDGPKKTIYYYLGEFETLAAAQKAQQMTVIRGYKDTFLVAFKGGKKIKLEEALK